MPRAALCYPLGGVGLTHVSSGGGPGGHGTQPRLQTAVFLRLWASLGSKGRCPGRGEGRAAW